MIDILNYTFFQNALWAILLISITSAIIGTYIVARRMLFITGGITHASFGGLGVGYYLGINPTLSALVFAILSALGVEWLSRGKSVREDSAIAVVWALGMAIGIIFIFMTPGYTPGLTEFLFGNILTITRTDIFIFAAFAALLILYTVLQYKTIVYTAFDADFAHTRGIKTRLVNYIMTFFVATAVVLTIRLVGIMLLISILSLPQMIAELFCHKFRNIVWLSGAINLLCGIGGLLLSYWLDVPAGATIVFTLIIAYFVVKIIASYLHSATGNEYPCIAQLQSLGGSIYCQHIVFFAQLLQNVFRILCGTDHHRHRINAGVVYDNGTALFQEVCIPQCFQPFKSDQNVCLSFFYDRFCYRFAVADECYYAAATLCHAMHFR